MRTRSFILNGTINARRIKQLIAKIEVCKAKYINVYLDSGGGESNMADIFIDFTHKTNKKINFIGSGSMASCCIHIFMEAKGEKSLKPYTCALLHLVTVYPESICLLNKKSYETVLMNELKKENAERLLRYVDIFELSAKEKSILNNGGDLGIEYERLKKALPKINKK